MNDRIATAANAITMNAAAALILAATLFITFAIGTMTGIIHTYNGQNAGVTIGTGCTGLGYEYRGHPGFFTNLCQ